MRLLEATGKWGAHQARVAIPALAQPLAVIAFAFVAVIILLVVTGYDPLAVSAALARSIGSDIGGTIRWTTPLILTGVAFSLAFRAGALNIGVDGQIYLGGIFAAVIALGPAATLPSLIGIPLVLAAAVVGGAVWAFIPAILRVRFAAPELVTTILLISVAALLVNYLVLGPMAASGFDFATLGTAQFERSLWLPVIIPGSTANIGIFISLAVALIFAFIFFRTTIGYELKMVGQNRRFAIYGGINHVRTFMLAMVGSGAIGGLVGGMELLGVLRRMPAGFNPGLGFDGIVVALLARNHPIGCIFAACFFGALKTGALNMERVTATPRDVVQIVEAMVVLAVSAQLSISWLRRRGGTQPVLVEDPGSVALTPLTAGDGKGHRAG